MPRGDVSDVRVAGSRIHDKADLCRRQAADVTHTVFFQYGD
jgi:hypothetical protein